MAEIYEITRRHLHILIVSAAIIIVLVLMLGIVVGKNISLPHQFPAVEDIAQKAGGNRQPGETEEIKNLRSASGESSTKPFIEDEGHTFYEKLSDSEKTDSTTTVVESFNPLDSAAETSVTESISGLPVSSPGTAEVPTPDVLATAPPDFKLAYVIQTSSVSNRSFAEDSVKKILAMGYPAYISNVTFRTGKENFRVRVGPYEDKGIADEICRRIKADLNTSPLVMIVKNGER